MTSKIELNNQNGFTLIELMIVIAIIGALAAIVIPNFIAYKNKAYCGQTEVDAHNTIAALSSYFSGANHTSSPVLNDLINGEELSLNNAAGSVIISGSVTTGFTVTVTDDSNLCPRGTSFSAKMGAAGGSWN